MNQITAAPLGKSVSMASADGGFAVTPQTLNDVVEFAKFMCQSNAGIPSYLRGNGPDCAAVIMQALKWGFDPFSVAQKSYKVKDVLAYEAQLIAAVINARSGIKGRLKYRFEGTGDDLTCTVTGILDGEECSYTSPRVGNITTKNSPLWKTDPQQQLGYYASRNWARRHCPEVILGVYDRDEAEEFRGPDRAKDITPAFDPFADDLPTPAQGASHSASTGSGASSAVLDTESASAATSGDLDGVEDADAETIDSSSGEDTPSASSEEAGSHAPGLSASKPISSDVRQHLIDYARKGFSTLAGDLEATQMKYHLTKMEADYRDAISDADWPRFETVTKCFNAVISGKRSVDQAREFLAGDLLDCDATEIGG